MSRKSHFASILAIVSSLQFGAAAPQAASQSQPSGARPAESQGYAQPRPVSLPHLYWHFLAYQHHLDEAAAEHEKQGKNGQWLRDYLRVKLGFDEDEFAPVRISADRLTAKIQDLESKAKAIAASDREARAKGLVSPGAPAPGLEQLRALTAERETDISAEVDYLNQTLSKEDADSLRKFLNERFSLNVTTLHIDRNLNPPGPILGTPKRESKQP